MDTLPDRCIKIWESMGVSPEDIQWGLSMLTQEAKDHSDCIPDEQIRNSAAFLRLFSGLPQALLNYCAWEKNQY